MAKNPNIDYWSPSSLQSEPDLRQEMINTLVGRYPEIAKGKTILLRKFRHDANGSLTLCGCVDSLTGEQDKDIFCPVSFSERHLWDESRILAYHQILETNDNQESTPAGLLSVPFSVFYMRYDVPVTEDDKLVEVSLDLDGTVSQPFRRLAVYRINQLIGFRADNGRLEFWKALCTKEFTKFINPPVFSRT